MQTINDVQSVTVHPTQSRRGWLRPIDTGFQAGLASGLIVLVPVLILQAERGVGVIPEMQLAASSLMGITAYAGTAGLLLGILLHFFVAIVPAVAYALVASRLPELNRWAWISGPLLGLIVFFFMGFIVLPHSAFTTPASVTTMPFVAAILIHMFGLGLPISLFVHRAWRRSGKASH